MKKEGLTEIAKGPDPPFLDDFLFKARRLGATLADFEQSPDRWWDWPAANDYYNFTADSGPWRVHYSYGQPLTFYHDRRLALGVEKPAVEVRVDQAVPDVVWARIDGYVVVEREDFPRFQTEPGFVRFSHNLGRTEWPNVWDLGNGYALACTRELNIGDRLAEVEREAWWMVGRIEDAATIGRRVMAVKVYDGPYAYSARGTDVKMADPVPLPSEADYVMYSYDEAGLRGLYRERHLGTKPQKKAMTIDGDDLLHRAESTEGEVRLEDGKLVGSGRVTYRLPLGATKMLNFYTRGNEVSATMEFDRGGQKVWAEYDGLAVNELLLRVEYYDSLSSLRLEWEKIEAWEVVGRPRVDVIPSGWRDETGEGNVVRLTGREGEGLLQTVWVEAGEYTASTNVRCHKGSAVVDVGGEELARWYPLDKSIRNGDAFVVEGGPYDILLTGLGEFSYDVDRFRVAPGLDKGWVEKDVAWEVETEGGAFDATESINRPKMSVSIGDARRHRVRIRAPENLGDLDEISVDRLSVYAFGTGASVYEKVVRWYGDGASRLHWPETITAPPNSERFISLPGAGIAHWSLRERSSEGDVTVTIDGSTLAYGDEYAYLDVVAANGGWGVEVREDHAVVFLGGEEVARLTGVGLPFKLAHHNTEDAHLDCPAGVVQLRRGLGPRFQGWSLAYTTASVASRGEVIAFGRDPDEAADNLPFYSIRVTG